MKRNLITKSEKSEPALAKVGIGGKKWVVFFCFTMIFGFMYPEISKGQTYTLCTSTSDLVAGGKYIIVSSQSNGTAYALGYQNTNNRPQATTSVTISSGTISGVVTATSIGDLGKPYEITLGGSNGAWTLYDAVYGGYLYAASSSKNYLRNKSEQTTWTITFSSNAAIMTSQTGVSRNILRYNSSSSLFSCYSSGQNPVYLYKKASSSTPNITATPTSLNGFFYVEGSGPSSAQSFDLSGSNLTGAPGYITVTAPTHYEISLDGTTWSSTLNVQYSSATLPVTTVHVKLKAGLAIGTYNNEMINISGGGSSTSVECNGYVSDAAIQAIEPGDLAILAFNVDIDGSGTDEISFVCFVPISVGAIIDITDNAYEKCNPNSNGWGISEGWIRFERINSPLPEGEVVTVRVSNGTPSVVSPDPINWTTSKPQPTKQGTFNMNEHGEQIFFLTGGEVGGPNSNSATSDAGTYSGYFLYGFNTKGNYWVPVCGNAAAGGTQNSAKPKNFDCFLVWPTSQADRNKYTGPLTPTTQRDWIDRIGDTLNWTGYTSNAAYNSGPNYIGRTISITPGGFSHGKWVGTTSTDWFECSNWESMRVPDLYTDVIVPATGVVNEPSIGAPPAGETSAYCNDITIFPSHTLTINKSQSKLEVYGNLENNGSLLHTNGTIYLKGALNTTFTGANDITVYNLDLSKIAANNVTLGKNLNISNKLTLTKGIITTGANRVTITNTAPTAISRHAVSGSSAFTGYINGNLRRHVATTGSYDFPVGTATQYEYSNINLTTSSGLNYIDASFTAPHTTPIDITSLNLMVGPTHINELLDYGFWTITPSGGTYTYNVTLTERGHTNPGASAETHTIVKRPNASSNWELQGTHNNSTQSMGSTPANWVTAKRTSLNIFSDFAIAKSNIGALPVELISFDAYLSNGVGVIDWSTASETNCSHFVIERSVNDMMYFEPIATVAGSGNSNMLINYSIKDYDVQPGINYYRLVQYDYDGSWNEIGVEYIVLSADKEPISIASISNTINGVLADIINIQGGYFEVQVLDVTGKLVYSAFSESGDDAYRVTLNKLPANGIYILRVNDGFNSDVKKFVVF